MAMNPAIQVDSPEFVARLHELAEPVVRSEGLMLVELIWRREGKGRVLRLYVDRPEGGVTLDDCALVSRQLSHLLDVEDLVPAKYRLEVSSPGLTRQLKSPREYDIFAGRPARLVVKSPDGRTETVKGLLKGLAGEEVLIETKGRVRSVPLNQVAKANLEIMKA
jgi:ribosome maturation factor RimP